MSEQGVSDPYTELSEPAYKERYQDLVNKLSNMTTEELRLRLKDSHILARATAAQALGNRRDTGSVLILIPLLRNQEIYVRGKVAEALGKIGDVRAIPTLLTALREDNDIYLIAAQALKEIGLEENAVLSRLVESLVAEQGRDVRERVAEALGLIGDMQASSRLMQIARQDTDNIRRIRAIEAIGILRDKSAVDTLFLALQDSDKGVRIATQEALKHIRDSYLERNLNALNDRNWWMREEAAKILGQLREARAIKPLIEILLNVRENARVRGAAAKALGMIGDRRALKALQRTLFPKPPSDDELTLTVIAEIEKFDGIWVLAFFYQDQTIISSHVREAVECALQRLIQKQWGDLLTILRNTNKDVEERKLSAKLLGLLPKPDGNVMEAFIAILQDTSDNTSVRIAVANALKPLKDSRTLKVLQPILQDPSETSALRIAATEALGEIGTTQAFELLAAVTQQDLEDDLRKTVTEILGGINDERVPALLVYTILYVSNRRIQELAVEKLKSPNWHQDAILELLKKKLSDPDNTIRRRSAEILGELRYSSSIDLLSHSLYDPDSAVRKAAVKALRLIGGPEVVEPLISALNEQDLSLRVAIIEALGSTASSRAVEPLISELEEQDLEICQAAVTALSQIDDTRVEKAIKRYRQKKDGYLHVAVEDGLTSLRAAWTSSRRVRSWKTIGITIVLVGLIIAGGKYIFRPAPAPVQLLTHYPYSNSLVLDDPLRDASQGYGWDIQSVTDPGTFLCLFKNGAYYATASLNGTVQNCTASGSLFKNFTYEVQMTLVQGDLGGIVFRFIPSTNQSYYYAFYIDSQGDYLVLALYPDSKGSEHRLLANTSSAIKQGYNQTNLLAVTAYGDQLKFYVNQNEIASIHYRINGANSVGTIGMSVAALSQTTIALFKNALVWKLPDTSSGDLP